MHDHSLRIQHTGAHGCIQISCFNGRGCEGTAKSIARARGVHGFEFTRRGKPVGAARMQISAVRSVRDDQSLARQSAQVVGHGLQITRRGFSQGRGFFAVEE